MISRMWSALPLVLGLLGPACVVGADEPLGADGDGDVVDGEMPAAITPFRFGMNEWSSELAAYTTFRSLAPSTAGAPRICHVYTFWDIANHDPAGGDQTYNRAGLLQWFAQAQSACDEVLATFQGPQAPGPTPPPSVTTFEQAFVAFHSMTAPGQPLAAWSGRLSFTAWNEPNNEANSGNGLQEAISPELAAKYYLAIRKHCHPSQGCKVAAGDFATNGNTAQDIEWNCANDADPANTTTACAHPSSRNPSNKPPSYLDRYKHTIANRATDFGLSPGFRPEFFAYHPWHDVNSYIDSNAACSTYDNCATRRLLTSLGGSWANALIWDDEIGIGLQNATPLDANRQACGAAFLVRLTEHSSRIRRVYYMRYEGGNGPLLSGSALNPAGHVLASRARTFSGAACASTGL